MTELVRTSINTPVKGNKAAPIVHEVLRSCGQPLDFRTRILMQSRFRYDFGQVRIHTDNKAAESARAVNALGYTVGCHIAFASGYYSPNTAEGQHLLAHELAHSIQQCQGTYLSRGTLEITDPRGELEAQADIAEQSAAATPSFTNKCLSSGLRLIGQTPIQIARKADPAKVAKLDARSIMKHPDYIENDLVRLQFFEARQAILHYADGTSLTIGLVAGLIKPPLESVDYHSHFGSVELPPELKFIREPMKVSELPELKTYEDFLRHAVSVKFVVEPRSGKIIPNHLNPVTAPRLCEVLKNLEAEYAKEFDQFAMGMVKVYEKAGLIVELALFRATLAMPKLRARVPATAAAGGELVGPLGKLTQAEIEKAITSSGGRVVELYTKLSQSPSTGRAISFATDRALAEAARSGGSVFTVRIPQILLRKLELIGVAVRSKTVMGGVSGTEIRFLAEASKLIVRFLVQ